MISKSRTKWLNIPQLKVQVNMPPMTERIAKISVHCREVYEDQRGHAGDAET
jgi:hypothetical protein